MTKVTRVSALSMGQSIVFHKWIVSNCSETRRHRVAPPAAGPAGRPRPSTGGERARTQAHELAERGVRRTPPGPAELRPRPAAVQDGDAADGAGVHQRAEQDAQSAKHPRPRRRLWSQSCVTGGCFYHSVPSRVWTVPVAMFMKILKNSR